MQPESIEAQLELQARIVFANRLKNVYLGKFRRLHCHFECNDQLSRLNIGVLNMTSYVWKSFYN